MEKPIPQVTEKNYFDPDLRMPYMSVSQYKDFAGPEGCEARALATIRGTWQRPSKGAFIVGHYVEMAVTGDPNFAAYCEKNAEHILTKGGKKRAEFVTADRCVERLRNSQEAMMFIAGTHVQHEVPLSGMVDGVLWKGLADFVIESMKTVADLKAMKDFARAWTIRMVEGEKRNVKVEWFEQYKYPFQLWLYGKLLCQMHGWEEGDIRRVLVAVTKQTPCALRCLLFSDLRRLELYADKFLVALPRVQAVKRGDVEPTYCRSNDCAYCREHEPFRMIEAELEI